MAIISVDEDAENAIIVISGANMAIDDSDVARALDLLPESSVVLLQFEVPLDASRRLAEAARRQGVTVVLDPAPAKPLDDEFLSLVDIITPNEVEAETLVGFPVNDPDDAARAAAQLVARGAAAAVVKLGQRGAVCQAGGVSERIPSFKVEAVDTVAAGEKGGLKILSTGGLET